MVTRRAFLSIGAAGVAAAAMPSPGVAQTPKRGGTLTLRMWDPPHFDHILAHAYKTHVVISFTHSRLLRHRAGPAVRPGALQLEGDLAESWQQTSDTTYGTAASRETWVFPSADSCLSIVGSQSPNPYEPQTAKK